MVTSGEWHVSDAFRALDRVMKSRFDIVHVQYPTAGFGRSLGPQALSLLQRCVITIHEASQRHFLRRLALLPFTIRPLHLIFTSIYEQEFVTARAPWTAQNTSIIPVGSSIPVGAPTSRTPIEIVHFGLILPGKGLEDVLQLALLIKRAGLPLTVNIIGRVHPRHLFYFDALRTRSAD